MAKQLKIGKRPQDGKEDQEISILASLESSTEPLESEEEVVPSEEALEEQGEVESVASAIEVEIKSADEDYATPRPDVNGKLVQPGSPEPLFTLLEVARSHIPDYQENWGSSIVQYAHAKRFPASAPLKDCKKFLENWGGFKID